jgi:hypothetical protein
VLIACRGGLLLACLAFDRIVNVKRGIKGLAWRFVSRLFFRRREERPQKPAVAAAPVLCLCATGHSPRLRAQPRSPALPLPASATLEDTRFTHFTDTLAARCELCLTTAFGDYAVAFAVASMRAVAAAGFHRARADRWGRRLWRWRRVRWPHILFRSVCAR